MSTTTERDPMEQAEAIADALNETGEVSARTWEGDTEARVYITRTLSRGRRQDMGYLAIDREGLHGHTTRRTAWIQRIAESVS